MVVWYFLIVFIYFIFYFIVGYYLNYFFIICIFIVLKFFKKIGKLFCELIYFNEVFICYNKVVSLLF